MKTNIGKRKSGHEGERDIPSPLPPISTWVSGDALAHNPSAQGRRKSNIRDVLHELLEEAAGSLLRHPGPSILLHEVKSVRTTKPPCIKGRRTTEKNK